MPKKKRKQEILGYTLDQLASESGFGRRTIYSYVRKGLLPRPVPRGRHTRYEKIHLARLLAINAAHARTYNPLVEDIRKELDALGNETLLRRAFPADYPAAQPAPALPPAPAQPVARAGVTPVSHEAVAGADDAWRFRALVPGLVLLVKAGASQVVVRLANEIEARYGASGGGPV